MSSTCSTRSDRTRSTTGNETAARFALRVRWQTGDARLTRRAQRFIESADAVAVSHVTLWEFTIKAGLGQIQIDLPVFAAQVEAMGFEWLLGVDHTLALRHVEAIEGHRDLFDRMLVAQSRATLRTLITADAPLARYGALVTVM